MIIANCCFPFLLLNKISIIDINEHINPVLPVIEIATISISHLKVSNEIALEVFLNSREISI